MLSRRPRALVPPARQESPILLGGSVTRENSYPAALASSRTSPSGTVNSKIATIRCAGTVRLSNRLSAGDVYDDSDNRKAGAFIDHAARDKAIHECRLSSNNDGHARVCIDHDAVTVQSHDLFQRFVPWLVVDAGGH